MLFLDQATHELQTMHHTGDASQTTLQDLARVVGLTVEQTPRFAVRDRFAHRLKSPCFDLLGHHAMAQLRIDAKPLVAVWHRRGAERTGVQIKSLGDPDQAALWVAFRAYAVRAGDAPGPLAFNLPLVKPDEQQLRELPQLTPGLRISKQLNQAETKRLDSKALGRIVGELGEIDPGDEQARLRIQAELDGLSAQARSSKVHARRIRLESTTFCLEDDGAPRTIPEKARVLDALFRGPVDALFSELLHDSLEVMEGPVARALGAVSLDALDQIWDHGMRQPSPLGAAQAVYRELQRGGG